MNKLILASSSHYRKLLLERLQLPFSCHSPNVDEAHLEGETGAQMAERLAIRKAQAVAALFPDAAIIGSDQVAELLPDTTHSQQASQRTAGHIILGKPLTHGGAIAQLRQRRMITPRSLPRRSGVNQRMTAWKMSPLVLHLTAPLMTCPSAFPELRSWCYAPPWAHSCCRRR